MRLSVAIRDYLIEIEVRKYTPKTIKGYRNNLGLFLRFCEEIDGIGKVEEVTPGVVRKFAKYMTDRGKKGTYVNGLLKTVKSFLQYCYEENYGGFNTRHNFKWCKEEKPVILAFRLEHVRAMLDDCKGSDFVAVRDRAILTTLFETGIRCWESQFHFILIDCRVVYGKEVKRRLDFVSALHLLIEGFRYGGQRPREIIHFVVCHVVKYDCLIWLSNLLIVSCWRSPAVSRRCFSSASCFS